MSGERTCLIPERWSETWTDAYFMCTRMSAHIYEISMDFVVFCHIPIYMAMYMHLPLSSSFSVCTLHLSVYKNIHKRAALRLESKS